MEGLAGLKPAPRFPGISHRAPASAILVKLLLQRIGM
jgi:hypothetical protein